MVRTCTARAPGKLFLLGEYAVLDDGPAVVAAVSRYVEVEVRSRGAGNTVRLDAPDLPASCVFAVNAPPPAEGPLAFVVAAWREVTAAFPVLRESSISVGVRSGLGDHVGAKIGLGGSAAVSVACVAALLASCGCDVATVAGRGKVLAIALDAHRAAQDGQGSGADVAAAVFGGVIRFQRKAPGKVDIRRLCWPADAILTVGWTGRTASTRDLVRRYRTAGNGTAAARATFIKRSSAAVHRFVAALDRRELAADAVDAGGAALSELGRVLSLPVLVPELERLVQTARASGAAAKSSGAGGGDCGFALCADAAVAARVRAAWEEVGITPLSLAVEGEGVSVVYV